MKNYTIGFIFSSSLEQVLLVHKISPDWQKGRVNAVGGKIEEGETPMDCVIREIFEETSLKTKSKDWISFGEIINVNKTRAHLFAHVTTKVRDDLVNADGEELEWFEVKKLPVNIMTNLSWLIPLAIDVIKNKDVASVIVTNK